MEKENCKLVFCRGMNSVTDPFTDELHIAADKKEIENWVIDTNDPGSYSSEAFGRFLASGNIYAVFFNQVGLGLLNEDGSNFWNTRGVPVYDIIQDHPRYFSDSFDCPVCDLRVVTSDYNHLDFIHRWYRNIQISHVMSDGGFSSQKDIKPINERSIDVLYVGRCQRKRGFRVIPWMKDEGEEFYSLTLNYLLDHQDETVERAMEICLDYLGVFPDEEQSRSLFFEVQSDIEERLLFILKTELMKALGSTGANILLVGAGWKETGQSYGDNVQLIDSIDNKTYIKMLGNSKIHVNCSFWSKNGDSVRICNSMLAGSISVSDSNIYLKEHYQDGSQLILFDYDNLQQLAYDIEYLLQNQDKAQMVADNGYKWAIKNETWSNRLETILDYIVMDEHYQ